MNIFFASIVFGLANCVYANEMQLNDVLKLAMAKNAGLQAQQNQTQVFKSKASVEGSWEDPKVAWEQMTSDDQMRTTKLTVSQEIPLFGQKGNAGALARTEWERAQILERKARAELVFQITESFLNLYLANRQVALVEEEIAIVDQLLAIGRTKYTTGKNSKASIIGLQLEHAMLQEKKINSESEVRRLELELAGLTSGEVRAIKPKWSYKEKSSGFDVKESELRTRNIENNYDLQILRIEAQGVDQSLSLAKKSWGPRLEVMGGYSQAEAKSKESIVGLSFSLPLWAYSKQSEQVNAESANLKRVELEVQDRQIKAKNQLNILMNQVRAAQKKVELYEAGILPLARQGFLTEKAAFSSGQTAYSDLLPSLRQLYQSEFDFQKMTVEAAMLEAQLDRDFPIE